MLNFEAKVEKVTVSKDYAGNTENRARKKSLVGIGGRRVRFPCHEIIVALSLVSLLRLPWWLGVFILLAVLASPVESETERGIHLKSSQFWEEGITPQSGTFTMAELNENPLL